LVSRIFGTGIPLTGAPPAQKLDVQFVLTDLKLAKTALERVHQYAIGLEARVTILAAQVVPYPLPLEKPPVQASILQQRLRALAAEQSMEISVEIFLCRERVETFRRALSPESVVIVAGAQRGWWPTEERRLARTLRRDGHLVICV
jgi:hypothetical protein